MSQLFALVPVRVKISSNSAAEIDRAHRLVKNVVEYWQEVCIDDWKDNGAEVDPITGDPLAHVTKPEEQPSWLEVRKPEDTIEVTEEE